MDLEYIATNKISTPDQDCRKKYIELCWHYFRGHMTNPECTPINEKISDILVDGCKQLEAAYKDKLSLKEINLLNYGHLGFAVQIIYDDKHFKLRIFADKRLRERGLASTFEPMRQYLTSGPNELGLNVTREVEHNVDIPSQEFSFEDLEKQQRRVADYWYQYYLKKSQMEIGKAEGEEWLYNLRDKKRAEQQVKKFEVVKKYLDKNSFKEKLKTNSKLFIDMRDDFAKKFPDKRELIENTALGVLPWYHCGRLHGNFGVLLNEGRYLPTFIDGGLTDNRANFMEAELIVPPAGDCCKRIISLFPYTWVVVPELNQLQEEFFDDNETIQAMIGHEFGELVIGNVKPILVNPFDYLLNTNRMREVNEEYKKQQQETHKKVDKLMVEMGLGPQTKKMLECYRDKIKTLSQDLNNDNVKSALEKLENDIAALGI